MLSGLGCFGFSGYGVSGFQVVLRILGVWGSGFEGFRVWGF